jgi:hypothetical protein
MLPHPPFATRFRGLEIYSTDFLQEGLILFVSLEPKLVRLKELIFSVDDVIEQKRLIGAIIEEYKKESCRPKT